MRYYIVSWDCNGVEFFQDITKHHPDNWAKENLFASIKQSKKVEQAYGFSIQSLILRAQANHQRHYEIYVFTSTDGVDGEAIQAWFTSDPQGFADWVRKNHTQRIYSNRASAQRPAIV